MSMTERREPREHLGPPREPQPQPCHTNHTMAINPYPLTSAPPYGRQSTRPPALWWHESLATIWIVPATPAARSPSSPVRRSAQMPYPPARAGALHRQRAEPEGRRLVPPIGEERAWGPSLPGRARRQTEHRVLAAFLQTLGSRRRAPRPRVGARTGRNQRSASTSVRGCNAAPAVLRARGCSGLRRWREQPPQLVARAAALRWSR